MLLFCLKMTNTDDSESRDQADAERGLDLAVEALQDRFDKLKEDFRSVQARSGTALGLTLAVLTGSAVEIRKGFANVPGGNQPTFYLLMGVAAILLALAIGLLAAALFTRRLPVVHDPDKIKDEYWKIGAVNFQKKSLVNIHSAIAQMRNILNSSSILFNIAFVLGTVSIIIFAVLRIFVASDSPQ